MTALFDFQKEDVERLSDILKQYNRAACFSEVGTGKSIVALYTALRLSRLNTLIISPAFLKYNWKLEIKKHLGKDSYVFNGKTTYKNEPYYIINYENLNKLKDISIFDFIILDEVQYMKNYKAIRTKLAYKLITQIKYSLLLSATPISKGVVDFFMYSKILSPAFAKVNHWTFCNRYSNPTKKRMSGRIITEFVGINKNNIHEIRAVQAKYTIRRKAADVLTLPEMREIEVMLSVDHKAYDTEQLFKDFTEFMEHKKASEHLMVYKRENAIIKAKATAEYINTMSEPLVVFSDHPEALMRLQEHLELESEVIDGSVSMEKRQAVVERFQAGGLNIILASIGALSEGVTLIRAAKVIYNDLTYSPIKLQQSQGRIYRIGQTQNCQTIYILSSELDRRILEILRRKQSEIQTLTAN